MKTRRIFEVKWADAWGTQGYYRKGNDYTPIIMTDIGYLCEQNEDTIVICMSYAEDETERHLSVTPWEFVISMEELV